MLLESKGLCGHRSSPVPGFQCSVSDKAVFPPRSRNSYCMTQLLVMPREVPGVRLPSCRDVRDGAGLLCGREGGISPPFFIAFCIVRKRKKKGNL